MGKSRKKKFFGKYCGPDSDKKDKIITNRKFRKINKRLLRDILVGKDKELLKKSREALDNWSWGSDGSKGYRGNSRLRTSLDPKDREIWRKWMAK